MTLGTIILQVWEVGNSEVYLVSAVFICPTPIVTTSGKTWSCRVVEVVV